MQRQILAGEIDGYTLLTALDGAIRQLTTVTGDRKIVLFSPGFTAEPHAVAERLDRALRAGISVDVIDARGLWGDPVYDASRGSFSKRISTFTKSSEEARSDTLVQIVDGTGGRLYKNSNDLGAALEKAAGIPESSYLLAFTPEKVKYNGSFHKLKVKLTTDLGYQLTAREGYYEPDKRAKDKRSAAQALTELFFSQEERRDIPLSVNVRFDKPNGDGLFETVVSTQIRVQSLHFRRDNERWVDVLTEVCGVFDQNGNFATAVQNTTDLHLTREQLSKLTSGITVNSTFKLKRGQYVLRFVLQDRERKMISARSVSVEIG